MFAFSTLIVALQISSSIAGYTLNASYNYGNFWDSFTFFTGPDPTNGVVDYIDEATASANGLIGSANFTSLSNIEFTDGIYLGVDYKAVVPATSSGRQSVRISSNQAWTHGLFIFDIAHSPSGTCGTWPAIWLLGSGTWPSNGEIDIMEGVNTQEANIMTLHTTSGCSMASPSSSSPQSSLGNPTSTSCLSGPGNDTGCQIASSDPSTYGSFFNENGGGIYATEWTSSQISIWFFPRQSIPLDITANTPDPSTWGSPQALFSNSSCDIDSHFSDMSIIIDTTFCGDWAGKVWEGSDCAVATRQTCEDWVRGNPGGFGDAFWLFDAIEVYQAS